MRRRASLLLLSVLVFVGAAAAPAEATYPGRNGPLVFRSGSALYRYDLVTQGRRFLFGDSSASGRPSDPSWSPNGQRIVFVRGPGSIWTMRADGTHVLHWTHGTEPSFSPGGAIIFLNSGDIYTMADRASKPKQLTTIGTIQAVEWAPDGTKIGYEKKGAIWTMNPDGANRTCQTCDDGISGSASLTWSPFSTKIAFHAGRDVYFVNVNTGTAKRITKTPKVFEDHCSWSPDGKWLACQDSNNFWGNGFVLVRLSDSVERHKRVTVDENQPAWRPIV